MYLIEHDEINTRFFLIILIRLTEYRSAAILTLHEQTIRIHFNPGKHGRKFSTKQIIADYPYCQYLLYTQRDQVVGLPSQPAEQ